MYDVRGPLPLGEIPWGLTNGVTNFLTPYYETIPGPVRIVNTGNVDVDVRYYQRNQSNYLTYDITDLLLRPEEEFRVDSLGYGVLFRIDGDNTVTNLNRLPIEQDGYIYVGLRKPDVRPPGL